MVSAHKNSLLVPCYHRGFFIHFTTVMLLTVHRRKVLQPTSLGFIFSLRSPHFHPSLCHDKQNCALFRQILQHFLHSTLQHCNLVSDTTTLRPVPSVRHYSTTTSCSQLRRSISSSSSTLRLLTTMQRLKHRGK